MAGGRVFLVTRMSASDHLPDSFKERLALHSHGQALPSSQHLRDKSYLGARCSFLSRRLGSNLDVLLESAAEPVFMVVKRKVCVLVFSRPKQTSDTFIFTPAGRIPKRKNHSARVWKMMALEEVSFRSNAFSWVTGRWGGDSTMHLTSNQRPFTRR